MISCILYSYKVMEHSHFIVFGILFTIFASSLCQDGKEKIVHDRAFFTVPAGDYIGTTVSASQGTFSSPSYPYHYPSNYRFRYDIHIGYGRADVLIDFRFFDLEVCAGCGCDYLNIENRQKQKQTFCGHSLPNGDGQVFMDNVDDYVWITFHSNGNNEFAGFYATYTIKRRMTSLSTGVSPCPTVSCPHCYFGQTPYFDHSGVCPYCYCRFVYGTTASTTTTARQRELVSTTWHWDHGTTPPWYNHTSTRQHTMATTTGGYYARCPPIHCPVCDSDHHHEYVFADCLYCYCRWNTDPTVVPSQTSTTRKRCLFADCTHCYYPGSSPTYRYYEGCRICECREITTRHTSIHSTTHAYVNCDKSLNTKIGYIESPNWPQPYSNNANCQTELYMGGSEDSLKTVAVTFLDFDLEKCGEDCSCDRLIISGIYKSVTPVTLCDGSKIQRNHTYYIQSNEYALGFLLLADGSQQHPGYRLRYEVYNSTVEEPCDGSSCSCRSGAYTLDYFGCCMCSETETFTVPPSSMPYADRTTTTTQRIQENCSNAFYDSRGVIESPRWPDLYQDNVDCRSTIHLGAGNAMKTIALTFDYFDIEPCSWHCSCDILIVSGISDHNSTLILCEASKVQRNHTYYVQSAEDKVELIFHTDGSVRHHGFRLSYEVVSNSEAEMCGQNDCRNRCYNQQEVDYFGCCICNTRDTFVTAGRTTTYTTTTSYPYDCQKTFTSSAGLIESPGWPHTYPNNLNCRNTIYLGGGNEVKTIALHFDFFDMEQCVNSEGHCTCDWLNITGILNHNTSALTICEASKVQRHHTYYVETTENEIGVNFHSDVSARYYGFRLRYEIVNSTTEERCEQENCFQQCPYQRLREDYFGCCICSDKDTFQTTSGPTTNYYYQGTTRPSYVGRFPKSYLLKMLLDLSAQTYQLQNSQATGLSQEAENIYHIAKHYYIDNYARRKREATDTDNDGFQEQTEHDQSLD